VSLVERNADPDSKDKVKWLINLDSIYHNFDNIPYFDESLRYYGPAYFIMGAKSHRYTFDQY
jgi:hypothetical protein